MDNNKHLTQLLKIIQHRIIPNYKMVNKISSLLQPQTNIIL